MSNTNPDPHPFDELTYEQCAEYLDYYIKFHLKPGDVEAHPFIQEFINATNKWK